MKKFIPKSHRHKVIPNAVAAPVPLPQPGAPMTMVRVPAALGGVESCVSALVCRGTASDARASVYVGRTYAFTGDAPQSFARLGTIRGFALNGTITEWSAGPAIENRPPAWVQLPDLVTITMKLNGLDLCMPEVSDFDALADTTLLFCGDEILSVARAAMSPDGSYTLTALRGRFKTSREGHKMGDTIWIAARARLKFFRHPMFAAGNTAKFKITIGKQPLASAIPFEIKL